MPANRDHRGESGAAQNSGTERGRPFAKGQSGNPGGRPKAVRELQERARLSVPAAFAFAEDLLADAEADARVRLDAAKFLTMYGLGAAPKIVSDADDDTDSRTHGFKPEDAKDLLKAIRERRHKNEPDADAEH